MLSVPIAVLLLAGGEYVTQPVVDTDPPLRVSAAWVREAPPAADVMAAYGVFCNDAGEAVTLAAISSPDFDSVEMHATVETDDAVTMEQMNSVMIGPDDCVAFEPGGRHFMLFDPSRTLRAGDNVEFTLQMADGQEMEVVFPVRRAGEMIDNEHEHH